jgi:hypothetical protein
MADIRGRGNTKSRFVTTFFGLTNEAGGRAAGLKSDTCEDK